MVRISYVIPNNLTSTELEPKQYVFTDTIKTTAVTVNLQDQKYRQGLHEFFSQLFIPDRWG
jgi:hypothetical protein